MCLRTAWCFYIYMLPCYCPSSVLVVLPFSSIFIFCQMSCHDALGFNLHSIAGHAAGWNILFSLDELIFKAQRKFNFSNSIRFKLKFEQREKLNKTCLLFYLFHFLFHGLALFIILQFGILNSLQL